MKSDLAIQPHLFPPLFSSVGELVVVWGLTEAALVHLIAIIYQKSGGRHIEAQIPVSFKRRRKFLRRCVAKIGPLASYAAEINRILDELTNITPIRNAVAHGAVSAYDPKTNAYTFTLLDTDDGEKIHKVNSVSSTLLSMRGAAIDLQRLTRQMNGIAERLMEAFVRK